MRREILDQNISKLFQHLELKQKERLTKIVFGLDEGDINAGVKICFRWSDGIETAQNGRTVKLRSTRQMPC